MPKRKLATRLRAGRGTLAGVATANFSGELSLAMVSPLIVNEGSQFGVTASRTGGASGDIAVDWRIVDVAGAIPSQGTFVWNNLNSTNQTAIVTAPLVTANDSGTIELYNPRGLNGTTAPRLGSPSSVALTVLNVVVNQPPAFTVAPSTATVLASGGTIQFTAADPEGLAITYSLVTPPSGYSINASTGLVTVAAGASGGSFIVRAADPSGLSVTTPCSVTIQQSGTNVPSPAVFPLELIYPRAAGTAPAATNVNGAALPGIPGTHRIFHAYPGIEYNIRASVIGGSFPYTFELSNAPAGMVFADTGTTSGSKTGEIVWPFPSVGTYTPRLRVTDAFGAVPYYGVDAQGWSSWTITVATTVFRFVDSVNGDDAWTGTAPTFQGGTTGPWRTLNRTKGTGPGNIVYLRSGVYTTIGMTTNYQRELITGTVDTSTFTPTQNQFETQMTAGWYENPIGTPQPGAIIAFTSGANAGWAVYMGAISYVNGKARVILRESVPSGAIQNGDRWYAQTRGWVRVSMHPGYNDPIQFVGYPGDPPYSAALDMGYQGLTADFGAFIAWRTNPSYPLYQDNLTIQNHLYMLNQMETEGNGGYNTIRRIRYRNLWQGVDGANSACMDHRAGFAFCNTYSELEADSSIGAGLLKMYCVDKFIWEDLTWDGAYGGPDLKSRLYRFEVRGCVGRNAYGEGQYAGIFGNLNNTGWPVQANGEIRYNLMYFNPTSRAVWLNQDGLCGSVNVYRNTLVGSVYVSTLNDANDGPFTFKNNVIVNSDTGYPSQIMTYGAYTNLVVIGTGSEANLAATSGIVDSAGNLTGTYQQYLGTHGYQIPE